MAYTDTLGYNQNNPFDLDTNPNFTWQGQIPSPNRYCQFDTPENGIRAGLVLLGNYQFKDGCRTVRDFLSRYAPATENDLASYIADVLGFLADNFQITLTPSSVFDMSYADWRVMFGKAIVHHEIGAQPYDDSVWQAAWAATPNQKAPVYG